MQTIPRPLLEFLAQSTVPITLTDANLPDDPIILANDAFYGMTGYSQAEILGRNCRFLQGADTAQPGRKVIRGGLAADGSAQAMMRNYRRTGEPFDNFLYIFTLTDANNRPIYRVGSQCEVPTSSKARHFEAHAATLREGIERLNAASVGQQVVDFLSLADVTVRDLFQARLQVLRTQMSKTQDGPAS